MKNLMNKLASYRKGLCLMLALLITLSTSSISRADDAVTSKLWTTVASAGTVDDADVGEVVFTGSLAKLQIPVLTDQTTKATSASLSSSAVIYYNVVALDGLFFGEGATLRARFLDNGDQAQVILHLKEVNLDTGVTTTKMTLDSNKFPSASAFQTQSVSKCGSGSGFNFANRAYFIEAQLIRTGPNGNPGLAAIQLGRTIC
jgi:hypothetical protein